MLGWACCYQGRAWRPGAPPLRPGAAPGPSAPAPAVLQQRQSPAPHSPAVPGRGSPKARPAHAPTSWPGLALPQSEAVPAARSWDCPGASNCPAVGQWDWDRPWLLVPCCSREAPLSPVPWASPAPMMTWWLFLLLPEEQCLLGGKWQLYSRFLFWCQGQKPVPLSGNRLLASVTVTVTLLSALPTSKLALLSVGHTAGVPVEDILEVI